MQVDYSEPPPHPLLLPQYQTAQTPREKGRSWPTRGGRVKWAEMASSGRRAPAPLGNPGRSGAGA